MLFESVCSIFILSLCKICAFKEWKLLFEIDDYDTFLMV